MSAADTAAGGEVLGVRPLSRYGSVALRVVLPTRTFVALIGLWWLATIVFDWPSYLVPTPLEVGDEIIDRRSFLMSNFRTTLGEALTGFALAIAIAVPFAVAMIVELARSLSSSTLQQFVRFRFPWSLPYVFVGLKVAITLAVIGAVVSEFVGATEGLGYVIVASGAPLRPLVGGAAGLTAIELNGVSHVFHARKTRLQALAGIDVEIRESEFVTLVGRSGCGKSTLLRIIAGLLRPTAGDVRVGGAAVRGPRRDVSFMFQRSALLPWRSVLQNVMLPVEILRLDRRRYRARAEELLALTGLEGFEDRRPDELSGGMQQRVSLCRALVHDPSVLLMDEPFAALDALTREELSLELQRIWSEHRKTIVFVTHSIQEATLLADRIVVMSPRPGRIVRTLAVRAPRPRSLGLTAHSDELDHVNAELHELLFARHLPGDAAERTAAPNEPDLAR